jgi:hypothetical protein
VAEPQPEASATSAIISTHEVFSMDNFNEKRAEGRTLAESCLPEAD